MPNASIDLGSNSILFLVLGNDGRVLGDESRVVALGRGLGDRGLLKADRMDAAMEVLREYAACAATLGLDPAGVRVAGTSALRRALNAATFVERVRQETGFHVEILSGDEEARLTAAGALGDLVLPEGPVLVMDVGGGSTELAFVRHRPDSKLTPRASERASLELGAVRLSEGFGLEGVVKAQALGRARAHVEGCFASFKSDPWPRALVAVGGSPTALVAARLGLDAFDTLRVHGETLELPTVRSWIERLSRSTVEERRCLLPATPDRAETILAGALVLEGALLRVHRPSLVVSARGLRHALAAGGAV